MRDKLGILRLVFTIGAAFVFYAVVMRFDEINILYGHPRAHFIGLMLTALFLAAGLIAVSIRKPPQEQPEHPVDGFVTFVFALMMIAGLMALRGALLYFHSGDYAGHLSYWLEDMRYLSVSEALRTRVGNYNMPYMYILLVISRINFHGLYLIKFASMIFDILLAYFVMKLVALRTDSAHLRMAAFIGALAIPTVVLNAAMWAQSDSIYTAFAVGAVYFALAGKGKFAYIFMGLAISFKLQAIFILPLFFVLALKGKIRLEDAWMFPATFWLTLLPAFIAGMPVVTALSVYLDQFHYYSSLHSNATTIWRLVGGVDNYQFITVGLFLAGTAVTAFLYFIYVHRDRITKTTDYVYIAYLFAVLLPFLLPKMHDRYLFMADVLSLVLFAYNKKRWYVPLVTPYASYNTYAFILTGVVLIDYVYVSLALGVVILLVLKDLVEKLYLQKEVY